ncbi:hypothetical protein Tco_0344130 [Tanacetum coccineum]
MPTLAENMILSGADNHPPMLDKALYDSWKSRMELYMQNREHGRMILESVEHGPLIWPTIEENGVTRTKKYAELSETEKIQADCDLKMFMQGTSLTKQERECKLYDEFDKFDHVNGESLHSYYLRFSQLINDMNVHKMNLEQFQINTRFLNSLPSEWSKFLTDLKLIDYTVSSVNQQSHIVEFPQIDSGLAVLVFNKGNDPIDDEPILILLVLLVQGLILLDQKVGILFNNMCEEKLEFLADLGIPEGPVTQSVINQNPSYQADDLDAYDSDCDNITTTKVALMANLSRYGSDVLFEYSVYFDYVEHPDNEITSDSNIIPYSQCLLESQNPIVQDKNSFTQQDAMILFVIEQMSVKVTDITKVNEERLNANKSLSAELARYKERVHLLEERQNMDLSTREKLIIYDVIREKYAQFADLNKEINFIKQNLSD